MPNVDFTGRTLNERYHVLELLGEGGMGKVYLGKHAVIGRKLAIKILRERFAEDREMVARFYREAQAAAAVVHRNTIEVIDVGAAKEGNPYIVMEYLEGESLKKLLTRAGPLSLEATLGVLEPCLLALEAIHKTGLVHRDLKPDNVFLVLEDDTPIVKLIDFGISKMILDADSTQLTQLTKTGSLLGTPAYMSPEQAEGTGAVDFKADIWAMGIIMYEMLTGKRPFDAPNYNMLIGQILGQDPQPPSELVEDFVAEAEPIILKTLAKEPSERWQSAGDLLAALRELPGYADRKTALAKLLATATEKNFAMGDLGDPLSEENSADMAARVMAKMASESTPSEWASSIGPKKKKSKLPIVMAAAAALAVVGGLSIWQLGFSEPAVDPEPLSEENTEAVEEASPATFELTLEGLPEGAEVFYDNARVEMNPIPVRPGSSVVPLKVELEGFETFTASIIPDKDRTVTVTMEKLPDTETSDPESEASAGADNRGSKSKNKGKAKGLKQSERGAEYVETFE